MEEDFFNDISKKPEFYQLINDLAFISSHKIIPRPYSENLPEYKKILSTVESKLNKYFHLRLKTGFHRIVVIFYSNDKPILVLKFPLFYEFTNTSKSESNYIKQSEKLNLRDKFPSFFKLIDNEILITSYAKPITENYYKNNYDNISDVGQKLNICDIEARNIGFYNGDWVFIDWGYELTIGFYKNSTFPIKVPSELEEKFNI